MWFPCRRKNKPKVKDAYSYFVVSDQHAAIEIEKFHMCSWLYGGRFCLSHEVLEIGLLIKVVDSDGLTRPGFEGREIALAVSLPWLKEGITITDLYPAIKESKNARFIFNEDVAKTQTFDGGEGETGQLLSFKDPICVLPVMAKSFDGELRLSVKIPDGMDPKTYPVYVRVALPIPSGRFCYVSHGLSRSQYSFDVKVNEPRNFPNPIQRDCICRIKKCFYLTILPSHFQIVFLNPETFKNVRILEHEIYNQYVKDLMLFDQNVKANQYQVVFNKSSSDHFLFFSVFESEHIGLTPLIITMILNILCTVLLMSTSTFKNSWLYGLLRGAIPWW